VSAALLTHTVLSPRIRLGEEVRIQPAVFADDDWSEDRPDGVSTLRHYLRAIGRRNWVGLAPLTLIPLVTLVRLASVPAVIERTLAAGGTEPERVA
jgi:hypothetical protein